MAIPYSAPVHRHAFLYKQAVPCVGDHQRWRADQTFGWKEVDVLGRENLASYGAAVIEQHLISDNLHRRHLDKLDLGRCYLRRRYLSVSCHGRNSMALLSLICET